MTLYCCELTGYRNQTLGQLDFCIFLLFFKPFFDHLIYLSRESLKKFADGHARSPEPCLYTTYTEYIYITPYTLCLHQLRSVPRLLSHSLFSQSLHHRFRPSRAPGRLNCAIKPACKCLPRCRLPNIRYYYYGVLRTNTTFPSTTTPPEAFTRSPSNPTAFPPLPIFSKFLSSR